MTSRLEARAAAGKLSYHVRILAHCGAIELVRTEQVRGSNQHFYRRRSSMQGGRGRRWRRPGIRRARRGARGREFPPAPLCRRPWTTGRTIDSTAEGRRCDRVCRAAARPRPAPGTGYLGRAGARAGRRRDAATQTRSKGRCATSVGAGLLHRRDCSRAAVASRAALRRADGEVTRMDPAGLGQKKPGPCAFELDSRPRGAQKAILLPMPHEPRLPTPGFLIS